MNSFIVKIHFLSTRMQHLFLHSCFCGLNDVCGRLLPKWIHHIFSRYINTELKVPFINCTSLNCLLTGGKRSFCDCVELEVLTFSNGAIEHSHAMRLPFSLKRKISSDFGNISQLAIRRTVQCRCNILHCQTLEHTKLWCKTVPLEHINLKTSQMGGAAHIIKHRFRTRERKNTLKHTHTLMHSLNGGGDKSARARFDIVIFLWTLFIECSSKLQVNATLCTILHSVQTFDAFP